MPRSCQQCSGDLDQSLHNGEARCAHGDAVDRALRALMHLDDERASAEKRKRQRLPANFQEAGEAFDLAGKREGVSGTYVRALAKIRDAGRDDLMEAVLARAMRPDQAARELVVPGDADDTDTWLTPDETLAPARREAGGGFDLDPATIIRPDGTNPTGAREAYSKQGGDDGLALSWTHDREGREVCTIWVNPPYSEIMPWIERAADIARTNPEIAIWVLIPAATETVVGQYALRHASAVCFLGGRVVHTRADGTRPGSPKWGSMVVAFGSATCEFYADRGIVLPGAARLKRYETYQEDCAFDECWIDTMTKCQEKIEADRSEFEQQYQSWLDSEVAA